MKFIPSLTTLTVLLTLGLAVPSQAASARKTPTAKEAPCPDHRWINIRTTAYTHSEKDHLPYGRKSAAGNTLQHGEVNSAAADWSRYPLGTKFKIRGRDEVYVIDDYGSALVGKEVIDLYMPTTSAMNKWGARHVDIEIIEWGDFEKSLRIMKPRAKIASHVRKMVAALIPRVPLD